MGYKQFNDDKGRASLGEVRKVYAELASRPVVRNCGFRTDCCRFAITGETPWLTRGEALIAARAVRAAGRKSLPEVSDGVCPLFREDTGRCLIYESRPFGCRTHFCQEAGGSLSRGEVVDLIHRLEQVDAALGGSGPQRIQVAVAGALREL